MALPGINLSVRKHLVVDFLIATALVATLVGINASSSFASARKSASARVTAEARWQNQEMQSAVDSIPEQLTSIVALPVIRSVNRLGCKPALKNFATLSASTHLAVVDQTGSIACSDGSLPRTTSFRGQPLLSEIFLAHRFIGGPLHDPTKKGLDVWFAQEFRSSTGRSLALVGMGPVAQLAGMYTHAGVDGFMVNTDTGDIFSAPKATSPLLGTKLDPGVLARLVSGSRTMTIRAGDGVRRIFAGKLLAKTNWAVIAGMPYSLAIAPARADLYRNLEVGGLIVVVLLALGYFLLRGISKPLRRLRRAMEKVRRGDVDSRAPIRGPAEFRELAGTFNEMLDARARSEARFRSLARYDSDFVTIVDADGLITYANPRAIDAFALDLTNRPTTNFVDLVDPQDRNHVVRLMREWIQAPAGSDSVAEFQLVTSADERRDVEVRVQSLVHDPSVNGLIITCDDITERKAAEARLTHAALHDSLTGLPNRPLVMDRLEHVLQISRRDRTLNAVLFLDLDNFKLINDTAGHSSGDMLLVQVAERLAAVLRPGDTLGRFGGDEFVVICERISDVAAATVVADRLLATRSQPYLVDGQEVYVSASIGISIGGYEATSSGLLRDADVAMYAAKASGRGTARVFDDAMRVATYNRLDLENALQRALERKELSLHYQPLVAIDDERLVAIEALMRWTMADGTSVRPDEFIPIAEETGLIIKLGGWVVNEGCRQLADWTQSGVVRDDLSLSINVSARQLVQPGFASVVEAALDRHGIAPARLIVEITESAFMQDAVGSLATLSELHALGVRIAVDDFGTGYSSLGYLERLPIDELKIDRAFISPLSEGSRAASIVESVVALGHALGLTVTAEGVEKPDQLDRLQRIGCDVAQGFLFSRPMSPTDLEDWLRGHVTLPVHPKTQRHRLPLRSPRPTALH